MPTTKKRTQVTHTREVEEALRVAHKIWPNEKPAVLIARLAAEGAKSLKASDDTASSARRREVDAAVDEFAGIYPPGYLDDLRDEWPA